MADELRHARGERTSFLPLYRDDHFPRRETQRAIKTFRDVRHSVANTTDFIFRKRSLDSSSDENVLETTRFLRWEKRKGWSPPLYIYIYINWRSLNETPANAEFHLWNVWRELLRKEGCTGCIQASVIGTARDRCDTRFFDPLSSIPGADGY